MLSPDLRARAAAGNFYPSCCFRCNGPNFCFVWCILACHGSEPHVGIDARPILMARLDSPPASVARARDPVAALPRPGELVDAELAEYVIFFFLHFLCNRLARLVIFFPCRF